MTNSEHCGFSKITLHGWRQFESVDIKLHPRLTVLTGANGSGKSTLLSILEGNLIGGNQDQFLATPEEDEKTRRTVFSFGSLFPQIGQWLGISENKKPSRRRLHLADPRHCACQVDECLE